MFDRHLEVAGHPCRQFEALRIVPLYPRKLGLQTSEGCAGVRSQRRNRHQPDELQTLAGLGRGAEGVDRFGVVDIHTPERFVSPSRLICM